MLFLHRLFGYWLFGRKGISILAKLAAFLVWTSIFPWPLNSLTIPSPVVKPKVPEAILSSYLKLLSQAITCWLSITKGELPSISISRRSPKLLTSMVPEPEVFMIKRPPVPPNIALPIDCLSIL